MRTALDRLAHPRYPSTLQGAQEEPQPSGVSGTRQARSSSIPLHPFRALKRNPNPHHPSSTPSGRSSGTPSGLAWMLYKFAALWRAVFSPSATERPLGTIIEENTSYPPCKKVIQPGICEKPAVSHEVGGHDDDPSG